MFLGLFTTARNNSIYRKNMMELKCAEDNAKNTNKELSILLTAKKDLMKNDSNKMDIRTIIPTNINKNRM
jgi:hypothetical protein